jgi:hypothetical protein
VHVVMMRLQGQGMMNGVWAGQVSINRYYQHLRHIIVGLCHSTTTTWVQHPMVTMEVDRPHHRCGGSRAGGTTAITTSTTKQSLLWVVVHDHALLITRMMVSKNNSQNSVIIIIIIIITLNKIPSMDHVT